jgi:beta-glucosidase
MLKKGESKTASFTISVNDLKFYDNNLNYMAESGEFELMIGTNSEELKKVGFVLK